jgi:hypothetical protein
MRSFLLFAVLCFGFIFAIVAENKPAMIEKETDQIREPIEQQFTGDRSAAWQTEKDNEWQAWIKQIRFPKDCANPHSAIRELECKNQLQMQANTFERVWKNKVASGWKPDGVD